MSSTPLTRRPIKARDSRWAAAIASKLARALVKPNVISVCSVVFAAVGGACLASTSWATPPLAAGLFIAGALGIQLRLLCNLFDGMVAIEGGFKTKSGEVFNELPDRFADAFILIGFGWAARSIPYVVELGWTSAVLAVIAAYVRTLGSATGAGQNFIGPMAKQHRMATVTIASLLSAILVFWGLSTQLVVVALVLIVLGELITIFRRARWIVRTLEAK